MTYGIPRTIAFSNHTMYLLGSNKVMSLLPMSTSARDIASLQAAQESLAQTTVKHIPLSNLSDDCMDSQLTTLHSTAVGSNVYLICAGVLPTTALRVFAFDGVLLKGPYRLPLLDGQTNISSFASVSGLPMAVPGPDFLLLSMSENTFGMSWGLDGLKPDTTSCAIGDGTLNNVTASPSPSPDSDNKPMQSSKGTSVGGIAGGTVAAICILALLACRLLRKNRSRAKIDRIMKRHDGLSVNSPDAVWVTAQNTIVPPPPVPLYPSVHFGAVPTEEQFDLAQIEMQRMQLGPPPAVVGSSAGVVAPLAPPNPFAIAITAPATAQHLHSYQHQNPYQSQAAIQQQVNAHHLAHQTQEVILGEDSYSQHMYPDSPSGSSTVNLLPAKAPNTHADHHGSGSMSQSYHQSQSESSHSQKKVWTDDGSEDTTTPLLPPPPPYLAKATQFLSSPSAPSAGDHSR
ncbi:hypothetical protein EDD21DRAFT_59797 [Dissophora ornata]|nr:hypothetical protein EDD21DRAFT_59797 [Dissophora ornata]